MKNLIEFRILGCLFLMAVAATPLSADEGEVAVVKITFDDHIKPIFREHCTACHSQSDKTSGLALDTYGDTMIGGSGGEVVQSGKVDASRLYGLITHQQQPFMPPDEDPIAKEKLDLIRTWIEQGMPENAGSKIKKSNPAAAAMLNTASTGKPEGPPPMPVSVLREAIVETPRGAALAAIAASPWAPLLAIGGQEQVILVHPDTGELLGIIPFPEGEPQSLTFTRDGKQLLIGGGRHSQNGCAVLVEVETGRRITKVGDELDIVLAADISPDKKRIALAGPQKVVRIFDSLTGELQVELKKHTDWIYTLRFSPDGVLLASGDRANGLVIWEADSGNLYADLPGHKGAVTRVDFRADSNVLLSSSLDGTLKLWDMMESREIKSWAAHDGGVNDTRFSNDGLIASTGKDWKVKLWNGNGELQKEFTGLSESGLRVAITGDASVVAAGDWNGNIQLWRCDNPDAKRLVASNPPSIERRLELANQNLTQIQQALAQAAEQMKVAVDASTTSAGQLAKEQEASTQLATQLATATEKEASLKSSMTEADLRIADLEKQLADTRAARDAMATDLLATSQSVQTLTAQHAQAKQTEDATRAQYGQLNATTQTATQTHAQVQAQLDAAQAEVNRAIADKQAVEQRAAELLELASRTATEAKALSDQVSAATTQEQQEASSAEKLAAEVGVVRERLAALQKQLDEIAATQAEANKRLDSARANTADLKGKYDQAEQAAIQAQELLKLFQKSYKRPTD